MREVRPLDTSGQLFTIVLIFVGVGAAFGTLEGLFAQLVEAQTDRFGRRRTERRMADLRDHVVVCGYGRIGAKVAELLSAERQVLVVEQDADRAAQAAEAGYLVVHADATDDETLGRTAIQRASVVVAALPTDADNLFIVLSGRGANPSLRIVARAQSVRSDAKLLMAGADRVVNPEDIRRRCGPCSSPSVRAARPASRASPRSATWASPHRTSCGNGSSECHGAGSRPRPPRCDPDPTATR